MSQPTIEELLTKIEERKPREIVQITAEQLQGHSTEDFLNQLARKFDCLLHGADWRAREQVEARTNYIYASNLAVTAIMKALFSETGETRLKYPFFVNNTSQFKLEIENPSGDTIRERGIVYAVSKRGFKNHPKGGWQFIRKRKTVPYIAATEVLKEDFTPFLTNY